MFPQNICCCRGNTQTALTQGLRGQHIDTVRKGQRTCLSHRNLSVNGINIKLLIVVITVINPDSDSPVLSPLLASFVCYKLHNTHMPLRLESVSLVFVAPQINVYFTFLIIIYFTISYWPLPYIIMNKLQVYTCPLPPKSPSHPPHHPTTLGCHRALDWAPCVTQQIPTRYLFYIW